MMWRVQGTRLGVAMRCDCRPMCQRMHRLQLLAAHADGTVSASEFAAIGCCAGAAIESAFGDESSCPAAETLAAVASPSASTTTAVVAPPSATAAAATRSGKPPGAAGAAGTGGAAGVAG